MTRKIIPNASTKDGKGIYVKQDWVSPTDKLINLGQSFPSQYAFTDDKSRFVVAQCSRRAGKSNGLAIRFFKTLEIHPKSQCIYLALTLESAKDIMWPVLEELNDKYQLGCTFKESKLTMTHPNGATLRLYGADMKNFIKRLKGRKFPGVAVDEAQDFGSHLESLIDDVLTPCLTDYEDSWLAITGTPGPVPQGYFFDITQNRKYGYSFHEWTLLENPYLPDPKKFIADLMFKKQWDENHPTLLREWRNKWVLDVESLWVRYKRDKNHYEEVNQAGFYYILGVDLGFNDADALAVVGWHENNPTTYLIEERVTPKQGITELVEQIQEIRKKYNISKIVIDAGGLGKKIAEEITRRWSIPLIAADKSRKQEAIEILNDSLRTGNFKAKEDSRFAKDSYLVQIDWDKSTPERIVIKKDPHSDIIDAVLYAFRESPSFAFEPPKKKPKYGSKEWAEQQQSEMFEAAQEHFKNQESTEFDPFR